MYLFFDTETTGLPRNYKAPAYDLNNWPRLVQLAFVLYDYDGSLISEGDYIVKPNGYTIPEEASDIHRVTQEIALLEGQPLSLVLNEFYKHIEKTTNLVAHNMAFDEKIMGAEFIRSGFSDPLPFKNRICTMHSTTDFCKIRNRYGYKWPKLQELHHKLFGFEFEEAHNAAADIHATAKCFWELKRLNIL